MTLRQHFPTMAFGVSPSQERCLELLVEVGAIAGDGGPPEPLDALGTDWRVVERARFLWADLTLLASWYPQMTVRASVGWVLVQRTFSREHDVFLNDRAKPWVEVGLGEEGWLFDAAGVPLAEAREQIAAGTADRETLRVLAALRGVPLPVAG
jgi:hypothetical protein